MSLRGLREIAHLLAYCYRNFAALRLLMGLFVLLSLLAAITEGLGISLLVPFLEAAKGSAGGSSAFEPVLAWTRQIPEEHRLSIIASVLFAVVCLRGVLLYSSQLLSELLPLRLQRKLMENAYAGLLHVEVGYLNRTAVGSVTEAVGQLPIRISGIVVQVAAAIFNGILAVGYTLLMLVVSWQMTVASVVFFGIITSLLHMMVNARLRRAGETVTEINARNATMLHETVNGLRLIRLSAAERVMAAMFGANATELIAARIRVSVIRSISSPLLATAAGAFICVLLAANDLLGVKQSADWVTTVLIFNILVFRLLSPVSALNNARHYIFSDLHAFDEYDRLMSSLSAHRQPSGAARIASIERGIRFNNVRFAFTGSSEAALRDFDLEIRKGEMVALVGPSGAGKSTAAALLARLYDPSSGSVSVDGVDLRELDVSNWHRLLGVVSQEAFIFNDTLASNLRFARRDAGDAELQASLARAAATDILESLPDGLQTVMGERGGRLSGGQVQRIALARVLLSNPQLLILDEATSNLDSITEAAIQRTIEEIRPGLTILAIAHRLSTIVKADRIVVMENGLISAVGTHAELEATNGLYREFLRHQSATAA